MAERKVSPKTVAKSLADGVVQLAVLSVYMRIESITIQQQLTFSVLINKETFYFRMVFN